MGDVFPLKTSDATSPEAVPAITNFSLSRLCLEKFRNYAHAELVCDAQSIVLIGPNGAGKTNIMEALSLLAPGR